MMLILTRKLGERIQLREGVEIAVLSSSGRQVKLGFDVDPSIAIYREEIYQRVFQERLDGKDV